MGEHYIPRTNIVCTLGPASSSETVLRKMMRAGMDVARINFSHGTAEQHAERIRTIRLLNKKYRRHIRILGDLEGPRIRAGYFPEHKPVKLTEKRTVYLTNLDAVADVSKKIIPFDYEGSLHDLAGGSRIFMDDGNIVLDIQDIDDEKIQAKVEVGGLLKERKALNIPGASLRFPALTEKDIEDIKFAVEQRVDLLAQSFVRSAADVTEVRERIADALPECQLVAKIENRDGVNNIRDILKVADCIMIARGDLGVSIPIYEVPCIQKHIIQLCKAEKKPAITATQMLEHMANYPSPTRAEATDVANAVLDGTDSVMLSAETAIGKYPVEAVDMMNKIIKYTETHACPPSLPGGAQK